jgi:4a-hydroxytetrahydrobiopterin dehydratase
MSELASKRCKPCEGNAAPLTHAEAKQQLQALGGDWQLNSHGTVIAKAFAFKDFYRTMSFVNALAHIANLEDHHPDLEVGYNYCRVHYSTHAVKGLSENDFICAAKIEQLLLP